MKPDVLFLDNHLLVLNKPPGLLAQQDRTGDPDILTAAKRFLKEHFHRPGNVFLGLVHRLDRSASGVMVLARTSKAASRLSEQFRSGLPEKKYFALVEGSCRGSGTFADHVIKKKERVFVVESTHKGALYAELCWRSVDHANGVTLVAVELKTGRPHQIRVQFSHRGLPIVGDFKYGAGTVFDGRHFALHCYRLGIEHPVQKQFMQWSAMPPPSWKNFDGRLWAAAESEGAP